MTKCIYCKIQLDDSSVVDVCWRCGVGVWGENMFNAIVQNMEQARDTGNLFQGSITSEEARPSTLKKNNSLVSDAVIQMERNSSSEENQIHSESQIVTAPEIQRMPPEPDDASFLIGSTNKF